MRLYTQEEMLVNQLGGVSRYNPVKGLFDSWLTLAERAGHYYKSIG